MSERIADSRLVEWIRELFVDATAESMFRWVVVAWAVAAIALVVLDRFGSGLLGRSRPIVQAPPERARTWRWGRRTPPDTYSRLPTGTIDPNPPAIEAAESIPLSPRTFGELPERTGTLLPNDQFWQSHADPAAPAFGFENITRLEDGQPPERYNPITGRLESLDRDESTGELRWPGDDVETLVLGAVGSAEPTVELDLHGDDDRTISVDGPDTGDASDDDTADRTLVDADS